AGVLILNAKCRMQNAKCGMKRSGHPRMVKEEINDRIYCSSFSIQHSEFSISCHRLASEDGILLRLDGDAAVHGPLAVFPVAGALVAGGAGAGAEMGGDRASLRGGTLLCV